MIRVHDKGFYVFGGDRPMEAAQAEAQGCIGPNARPLTPATRYDAARRTIAYGILNAHTSGTTDDGAWHLRFDCLTSHDITYVGIIQTIRAARPDYAAFPVPYVLSNCHNSLCAVGGTINADDHAFGLSAAKKYGGVFVPPHAAVIHQYMRERHAACGAMILGSDSHTRYGALGTLGVGEGGGELVKQLLDRPYDVPQPKVVGVRLLGEPRPGVGPQDVALALVAAVFDSGFVKNKILEFFGPGLTGLSMDFRNGVDVMTTETACLSSVWATDETTAAFFARHGRPEAYCALSPGDAAYYDGLIEIDLSKAVPMIALPFHPSHAFPIADLLADPGAVLAALAHRDGGAADWLREKFADGNIAVDQAVIAGCAGGLYENIRDAADIYGDGGGLPLTLYPASQPIGLALAENGVLSKLTRAGAVVKTAFCGPCFGAGDIPVNNGLSARHTTRNFPSREGGKPASGQRAGVVLMDARSIAATARAGGRLTAAGGRPFAQPKPFFFDAAPYARSVYDGTGRPEPNAPLRLGPGIRDWPPMAPCPAHLLLVVAAFITDPVTTTDELIPSGETSSYRSNPLALAEFTLSRKDPGYVARAKAAALPPDAEGADGRRAAALALLAKTFNADFGKLGFGSLIYARRPGDGSAREQAASCQRVLGGRANIAREYATQRYRSNLVNWGVLPFILPSGPDFAPDDLIFFPDIRDALTQKKESVTAYIVRDTLTPFDCALPGLTAQEAEILLDGGLINYYGRSN